MGSTKPKTKPPQPGQKKQAAPKKQELKKQGQRRFKLRPLTKTEQGQVTNLRRYRIGNLKFFQGNPEGKKANPQRENIIAVPSNIAARLENHDFFIEVFD